MTVLEAIQKSAEFLQRKGVESARLHAELLLAHVLKLPRMKLYLNFERALSDAETDAVREFVRRRSLREPVQHITGSTSFCGFEIAVNRHVLVPRPETELLAEMGWEFLGKLSTLNIQRPTSNDRSAGDGVRSSRRVEAQTGAGIDQSLLTSAATALDFGTGSGCIAIAISAKCPRARVVALEASADALEVARKNAAQNAVAERLEFVQGRGLDALPPGSAFDLIVSNPPYIPTSEIATLAPEVKDFDPHSALDGGADGMDFYRMLAVEASPLLKPAGKIMLEFGDGQDAALKKIFTDQKWIVEEVHADYTQRPRILIARR